MIIADETAARLEFQEVRKLLALQAHSESGRQLAAELSPCAGEDEVAAALAETREAQSLLDGGTPPLGGNQPLSRLLARASASGSLLSAEQLQDIKMAVEAATDCRRWADPLDSESLLASICLALAPLSPLARRLEVSIGARGELLDTASFELGDIRRELRQIRFKVKQQLDDLLSAEGTAACFQDQPVTVRNGRYVVPLKTDYRGQVKGLVHDESSSGQTLYLEPEQVLEGNNRLQQLLQEEKREERRILLNLTELVREHGAELAQNEILLTRLDLRFAAARFARQIGGQIPELVTEPMIELRQARHPLLMLNEAGQLEPQRAIPTDLLLDEGTKTLVISGPNTGGKSVALKSFGLLLIMVRSGLPIPCAQGSRIHLFAGLFVDIGDQQSISEQLSTFSGHLLRLQQIMEKAGEDTLVLLDEAGTGTDPAEGAALVIAALEQLQQAGARTVLTTHLGRLKTWAAEAPQVENAAVEIDPQTLRPYYRLNYGIPGASSAMATARRLGLPMAFLERAQELLGEQPQEGNELLLSLAKRQRELEGILHEARQERSAARQLWKMRREQLEKLQQHKGEIRARAVQQAEGLIAETTRQLRKLRKAAGPDSGAPGQVAQAAKLEVIRQQLTPYRDLPSKGSSEIPELEVGELVQVVPLGVTAEVVRLQGKSAQLQVAGKRMRQPLQQLVPFSPRRFAEQGRTSSGPVSRPSAPAAQSRRLVLVGQRVEPALKELERFVDNALLASLGEIEIVHGSGTGAMRQAVREFLATQSCVSAFYAAAAEQGGEKVTIAELGG